MTASRHRTSARRIATVVGSTLLVAACSGGGSSDSADTTTVAEESTTTTASTTTTTTATTIAATSTSSGVETSTTVVAEPVMPLTGQPIEDQALANRPALVVKIDNHPDARPQSGLNAADIVFEENVESLTRFAVVFQSQDSDPVGPIRSGRTQDIAILGSLNQPLFAWSGGNPSVTRAIDASDLIDLSQSRAGSQGGFFRSGDRKAPHNLYAKTSALYTFTPIYAPAPPQQFQYRADGEAFNGVPSLGVDLKMDGVKVNWTWNGDDAVYLRSQGGTPHMDADLGQVNAANVVVLEVDYKPSPADARSPEAQTIGTGKVYVFTAGVMIEGTWTRADRLDPFTLADTDGNVISLTPGRTWVELARIDTTTPAV